MQTNYGSVSTTKSNYQTHNVVFNPAFTNIPFVSLSVRIKENMHSWNVTNLTANGFTLEGYGNGGNSYTGTVEWKAEEH